MPSPRKHSDKGDYNSKIERDNKNNNEELLQKIFERLDSDRLKARQEMKEELREMERRIVDKIQNTIEEKF